MLTKMPKVGDVLIANEKAVFELGSDVTRGKEYTITRINEFASAIFLDDVDDEWFVNKGRFGCFSLKEDVVTSEPVGYIELHADSASDGRYSHIAMTVDNVGFNAVQALAETSKKQRSQTEKRTEIQGKIDALQAELGDL